MPEKMYVDIKIWFKRSLILANFNQSLKSFLLKRRYKKLLKFYGTNKSQRNALNYPKLPEGDLNILLLGTDYDQDSSGMLQALDSLGTVTVFTKADGSYGQTPSSSLTSLDAYDVNSKRLIEIIEEMELNKRPPHLIIGQMWGGCFNSKILDDVRDRLGTVVINIAMDDRHTYWGVGRGKRWMGSYGLIHHIDMALTAAPECVDWYSKEGCPAIFFPEASDPDIFQPMPNLQKIYDVTFVGARYGVRDEIITALRAEGISVAAFGNHWESGKLMTENVPKVFAQSKIILGVGTIGHCKDFYALKLRDFDAPMSGSFYLTSNNQDLANLYDIGHEIETYNDIAECVQKVRYYLEHDEERELIALSGYKRARKDHTWHKRFNDLFDMLRSV